MRDEQDPPEEPTSNDYAVGYKKPPEHTRFRPGQSGNLRGRPKGTRNLKTDLIEELGETVLVREGDHSRRVSKQRAVVKTLVTRTLKGDARAANLLLSMMWRLTDTGEGIAEIAEPLLEDELAILKDFEARARRVGEAPMPCEDRCDAGGEGAS